MSWESLLNDSSTEEHRRDAQVKRVILIEGLANLTVLVAKGVVGIMTSSFATIADTIHSMADVADNLPQPSTREAECSNMNGPLTCLFIIGPHDKLDAL